MKFEDIFKEEGLYRADSFMKGVAFKIKINDTYGGKELFLVTFKDKNDLTPESVTPIIYDGLFKKEYTKVHTRQALFL